MHSVLQKRHERTSTANGACDTDRGYQRMRFWLHPCFTSLATTETSLGTCFLWRSQLTALSCCSSSGSQVCRSSWQFCSHLCKREGQNPWTIWWAPCLVFSVATQKEVDLECSLSTGMKIITTKLSWELIQQERSPLIFMITQPVSFSTNY